MCFIRRRSELDLRVPENPTGEMFPAAGFLLHFTSLSLVITLDKKAKKYYSLLYIF